MCQEIEIDGKRLCTVGQLRSVPGIKLVSDVAYEDIGIGDDDNCLCCVDAVKIAAESGYIAHEEWWGYRLKRKEL